MISQHSGRLDRSKTSSSCPGCVPMLVRRLASWPINALEWAQSLASESQHGDIELYSRIKIYKDFFLMAQSQGMIFKLKEGVPGKGWSLSSFEPDLASIPPKELGKKEFRFADVSDNGWMWYKGTADSKHMGLSPPFWHSTMVAIFSLYSHSLQKSLCVSQDVLLCYAYS